jgi:hypothetical protein
MNKKLLKLILAKGYKEEVLGASSAERLRNSFIIYVDRIDGKKRK